MTAKQDLQELRKSIVFSLNLSNNLPVNNSINQNEKAASIARVDSIPVPSLIAVLKAV